MSRSLLSNSAERSWLERPIYYDRVPLQPRRTWVTAIEIALLAAVMLVITIEIIF